MGVQVKDRGRDCARVLVVVDLSILLPFGSRMRRVMSNQGDGRQGGTDVSVALLDSFDSLDSFAVKES